LVIRVSDVEDFVPTGSNGGALRLLLLGFVIALAACAATGTRYAEDVSTFPGIPAHATRLTVFRTAESTQYSGRSATVRVDGREVGGCDFAGYQTFSVPAGPHVLAVEMWDAPGKCRLSIDVLGGEEYFYEISPRTENLAADFLGTVIGAMGGATGLAIAPFVAMGAESKGRACGGAFSITGVEESIALRKVRDLRKSR
jgi:hypothetical protein